MNTITIAKTLARSIMAHYKAYKVLIILQVVTCCKDSILYQVHIEPGTTINSLMTHAKEVKTILKIPYFILAQYEQTILLSISSTNTRFVTLDDMLHAEGIEVVTENLLYPIALGKDIFGKLIYEDLADMLHTAYTGSTGSGKSVGLQCLIMSLASFRSPEEVNFVIIDGGGGSLWCFEGLPHLSYPVIKDTLMGIFALEKIVDEINRRLTLSNEELDKLPAIVCVFDEFASFIGPSNNGLSNECKGLINDILRRARKVRIYLVLATQSPNQMYLKGVELNNLTSRVAFRNMSKANQSSALGVSGAENLMGKGDLLLDTQGYENPFRLQGAYISKSEIEERVAQLADKQYDFSNKFIVPERPTNQIHMDYVIPKQSVKQVVNDDETKDLIMWTLEQTKVSSNQLQNIPHFSRNNAKDFLDMMEKKGFISAQYSNQPREVIPQEKSDLNEEQLKFLSEYGISDEDLTELYQKRNQ
ncbi:MAG: FtsK/SpoIIIE domain-containing protein [Oscillospiraceae bacterium]